MKKRILSMLLTIIMICTLLPIGSVADGAISAKLGSQTVSITYGQNTELSFTPEEDSWYLIYTTGNYDTCGWIDWPDKGEQYDDNSGNSMNLLFKESFSADVEYIITLRLSEEADGYELEKYNITPVEYGETVDVTLVIEKYELPTSGQCGDNVNWRIVDEKNLTISGTGPMWDFEDIDSIPWDDYAESIKSVVVEDGVTSIGYGAFSLPYLASVTIGNSVRRIGPVAFAWCENLTNVTLPDSVQSIEDNSFSISGLTRINLGNGVKNIGDRAFLDCFNLTSIILGSDVEYIGESAFLGCSSFSDVYYIGMQNQWNAIEIAEQNNQKLTSATIHFLNPDKAISAPAEAATGLNITPVGDALPSGAGVSVESADAQAVEYVRKELGNVHYAAYEINLRDAHGNTIQPDSGLLLMDIDVPEGFVGSDCAVFRAEKDDSLTDMHAKYVNGKLQFPSEHCSLYIITDKQPVHSHSPAATINENIVAATCAKSGSHDEVVYCSECGNELSRSHVTDAPTGTHNFKDGKCSVCGEKDPDFKQPSFFSSLLDSIRSIFKNLFSWLPFC